MFKFAGYEDLTLPCPVPCPVLPCPEQDRVKKEIFHPALWTPLVAHRCDYADNRNTMAVNNDYMYR